MIRAFRKLLAAGFAGVLMLSGAAQAAGTPPLPVVASFSILGDLVRVVGGERVSVTTLVGRDEDVHVFTPRPADARAIVQSRLLVINRLGFEPWAQKLARSAGYKGETVVASQGVKPLVITEDQAHGDEAAYVKELQALDSWASGQFATIPADKRKVITSHDAFGYFAAHYRIEFLAPQGVSTDAEPGAKGVAQLIQQIRREKIKAVFLENMSNPRLLAQLSKDAGVSPGATLYVDALSAPGGPADNYLALMRHNVRQLVLGMQKN